MVDSHPSGAEGKLVITTSSPPMVIDAFGALRG